MRLIPCDHAAPVRPVGPPLNRLPMQLGHGLAIVAFHARARVQLACGLVAKKRRQMRAQIIAVSQPEVVEQFRAPVAFVFE